MQLTSAHITILGGDVRYSYCAQQLRQAGWQVDTFQVQGSPDTMALPGLFQPQRDYLPAAAFSAADQAPLPSSCKTLGPRSWTMKKTNF